MYIYPPFCVIYISYTRSFLHFPSFIITSFMSLLVSFYFCNQFIRKMKNAWEVTRQHSLNLKSRTWFIWLNKLPKFHHNYVKQTNSSEIKVQHSVNQHFLPCPFGICVLVMKESQYFFSFPRYFWTQPLLY